MNSVGYWASQEQYSMQDLFKFVIEAEKGGFTATMTSDHFHPWWNDGGFGNFTWVWLAAAAERTKNMRFITGVTSPVYRYNPAIIAQAFASLDVLYPNRISLGVGTGEAMNEVSVGFEWPSAEIRLNKTIEAIEIINNLWNKDQPPQVDKKTNFVSGNKHIDTDGFLTYNGQYFKTKSAKLYTPPSHSIPLYMAASGPEAIAAAATFTDGLITISKPSDSKEMFDKFDQAAKTVGKDPTKLEKIGKPKISYSEDYEEAFKSANFWRAGEIENVFDTIINDPRKLQEKALEEVSDEKLKESTLIVTSVEDLIKPLEEYFKSGFTKIYLHSTSPNELDFVQQFCKKVLPHLNEEEEKNKY
ncbi:MAG TPA: LLM class flavin-dependent oxidoreductase [Candidatus Saccharimonadales bacterium]|nr:LLM class flavin-dependent oxidoreductase [Candidatus Saccharimonadales bacterium]